METSWLFSILKTIAETGVEEFCVCTGKRNFPLIMALEEIPSLVKVRHFEERSAAFYCLGRARATNRPVVVCVTSGTAVGELLPATMEAYYSGVPLILLTADRPRRYRGSGAPQAAEQKNIFGVYTPLHFDLEEGDPFSLAGWDGRTPLHINVCIEEPKPWVASEPRSFAVGEFNPFSLPVRGQEELQDFLHSSKYPFVIVGALRKEVRETVKSFLEQMGAPFYAEPISGLSGTIWNSDQLPKCAKEANYPIDGVLRIGGVPTPSFWRHFEESTIPILSVSELPFSGLSNRGVIHTSLAVLQGDFIFPKGADFSIWRERDKELKMEIEHLFAEEPRAEPTLMHALSKVIPPDSRLYLGNSLPIREWDLASIAGSTNDVFANRGLNGIDGQISTFLGLLDRTRENWGIFGDLTSLYDLAGPWALQMVEEADVKIVVINNSGGLFFKQFGMGEITLNRHALSFEGFAKMWGLDYRQDFHSVSKRQLIEIIPDEAATTRFWEKLKIIRNRVLTPV